LAKIEEKRIPSQITAREVGKRIWRHENAVLGIIFAAITIGMAILNQGKTLPWSNVRILLIGSFSRGIAAVGQAFVMLTAGIDVSIGGLALMTAMIGATTLTSTAGRNVVGAPLPLGVSMILLLLAGLGIGALNGLAVSRLFMPPLIVTLAMWKITKGIGYQLCKGIYILGQPESLGLFGYGLDPIPAPIILFIVIAVAAYFVLNYTTFGRSVYAVGGNPASAFLSGLNVKRILLSVYMISGFLAAVAGFTLLANATGASMQHALNLEIDSIAMAAVGGISLMGGRGNIIGVVLGTLIVGTIKNGLSVYGVDPSVEVIATGALIFAAIAVDTLRRR
jgi:ribose/xylose/arabinose/galactoside ABC-type transport system permease subunit